MNHSNINTGVSIDPKGLSALKNQARSGSDDALRKAAQQFEAKFIQMLLQSMRATVPEGEFSGKDEDLYQGMMDEQMAQKMASGRGFGLSESIVRQLRQAQGRVDSDTLPRAGDNPFSLNGPGNEFVVPARLASIIKSQGDQFSASLQKQVELSSQSGAASKSNGVQSAVYSADTTRQERFVLDLLPHAQRASQKLGVKPEVLIAQAALETGWGKHVIQRHDGHSSNNLFNIKAGNSWRGDTATVRTLEYVDGIAQRQYARFRAYDSAENSFNDYARLIATQPRYEPALQQAGDARSYLNALEQGGYATDPKYADKVLRVLQHPAIAQTLKNHKSLPIHTIGSIETTGSTHTRDNVRVNNDQG